MTILGKNLEIFLRLLHNAVHKCKLNLVRYYSPWVEGKRPFPLFPEYDEEYASIYANASQFIGWMIVRTLPLLQGNDIEFSEDWRRKYRVLDESFQEAIAGFPKQMGRSIEELIASKFNFKFSK